MQVIKTGIGPKTKFIISTSGRINSMKRYQRLLQKILNLDITYLPISAYADDGLIKPQDFANVIKGLGAIGGAISKDIKAKIVPYLDQLDPLAQKVQSVNTVINRDGKLFGYNTDAYGFREAIMTGIEKHNLTVETALVYGYGGVFNVVYHVLEGLGISVFVTGRNQAQVERVNQTYGLESHDGKAKDLFINATPVTDDPLDQAPGFPSALAGSKLAFDHHMPGAEMVAYCHENNIAFIPGTDMYYPQMHSQWALFLEELVDKKDLPELIQKASQ